MSENLIQSAHPTLSGRYDEARQRIEAAEQALLADALDAGLARGDNGLSVIRLEERLENQRSHLQHWMEHHAHGLQEQERREIEKRCVELEESLRTLHRSLQQHVQDVLRQHQRLRQRPVFQSATIDRVSTQLLHFQQTWCALEDRFFRSLEGLSRC